LGVKLKQIGLSPYWGKTTLSSSLALSVESAWGISHPILGFLFVPISHPQRDKERDGEESGVQGDAEGSRRL
jgi:hypothetical protein